MIFLTDMPDTKDNAGLDEKKEFSRNNKENFRLTGEEKKKKTTKKSRDTKKYRVYGTLKLGYGEGF